MAHDWQPDFVELPEFEKLVDEHQSMVFSLALRMTGDRGLAEEIAQDVFVELDHNLRRIESVDHACFWLRRVAMMRCADGGCGEWTCGWRWKTCTAHPGKSDRRRWAQGWSSCWPRCRSRSERR